MKSIKAVDFINYARSSWAHFLRRRDRVSNESKMQINLINIYFCANSPVCFICFMRTKRIKKHDPIKIEFKKLFLE